jgi:hypothetical protein
MGAKVPTGGTLVPTAGMTHVTGTFGSPTTCSVSDGIRSSLTSGSWSRSTGRTSQYGCALQHGNNVPSPCPSGAATMEAMSMYVDILSSALDGWDDELNGSALIGYAVACRTEIFGQRSHRGDPTSAVLAAQVAYDRALICLCTEHGIEVVRSGFAHRQEERDRLEHQLARAGVDLAGVPRRRTEPQD